MAQADRSGTRRTRRDVLTTAVASGVGAAAAGWFGGTSPGGGSALAAPSLRRGGTLKIAEVGEPLTLDVVASTADLTSTITLPVFDELFSFDATWRIQPSLAASTAVSGDGLTYTFTLRQGVPFHNGTEMTAADVVASLDRWGRVSPRGVSVYKTVDSVSAAGANTVVIKLKAPFAPLLAFLALPNGAAAIMPKSVLDATGTGPLRQFVGTGPYKFAEWAPDRYVHLTRFDQYAARSEPASGYGGHKEALADDIYYYPVSQVATRIAGVQSGDYDIADAINQDAYTQLKADPRVDIAAIHPGSHIVFIFNKKQGMMANVKMRQAVLVALDMQPIMQATFGNPDLYALESSLFPKGTLWYSTAGGDWYNVHNIAQAKQLAKQGGYSGQPIRWLTTQEYDYMFKSSVIAISQLQQAGFQVDMQVMEWASVLDRRAKPAEYDVFVTAGGFVPDPALNNLFGTAYPGWWDTPDKNKLFADFTAETDQAKRVRLWAQLQALWYVQAPLVTVGTFYTLAMSRKRLPGFIPSYWLVPWNVQAVR